MTEFARIPRPEVKRGPRWKPVYDAIIEAARDGEAVRVPLDGVPARQLANRLRSALRSRGAKNCHTTLEGDSIICWVEEIP